MSEKSTREKLTKVLRTASSATAKLVGEEVGDVDFVLVIGLSGTDLVMCGAGRSHEDLEEVRRALLNLANHMDDAEVATPLVPRKLN